jgi:hypothetical protein
LGTLPGIARWSVVVLAPPKPVKGRRTGSGPHLGANFVRDPTREFRHATVVLSLFSSDDYPETRYILGLGSVIGLSVSAMLKDAPLVCTRSAHA